MAYVKKHCSGCCSGCNNCYAQVDCSNGCSNRRGCGCKNHSCGSCSSSGCSSCNCGCNSCGSGCNSCGGCSSSGCNSCSSRSLGRNGFGTLRSVCGPFSNCGNWWNNDDYFPYYTGPCGPCDPCEQCCCKEWPWPWLPMPAFIPVNSGYTYPYSTAYDTREDDCGHDHHHSSYTSGKNCYRTDASSHEAYASRRVKPIVDCGNCSHDCDD